MTDVPAQHDHVLPDGTTVHIRPIRKDDAPLLLDMWDRLSDRTIRYRFLGPFRLNDKNVHRFTDLDPETSFALVATLGRDEDERIVGVCRFERLPEDPEEAEFAEVVEDAHQGRGIGTALLRHIVPLAREQGVERLAGDVLAENYRMLQVLRDLGLVYERTSEGITVHTQFSVEPTEEFLQGVARDEKRAAEAALGRFFEPEHVAVVGASRDPTSIGGLVFANLLDGGFQGTVYPVNSSARSVQSVAAYPSLSDLPETPDQVIVCVPAPAVNDVVDEAGKLGVRAVTIVSAGFAESGEEGRARQDDLIDRARSHGLRIVGPNCMGLLNANEDVRLNGTFSQTFPQPGKLSFSSQSGALGLAVLDHVDRLGLGISTFVSVGNKADVSGNDLLLYWEDDPDTDVMLLYLESFGNPRRFSRIARRISYKKPIVAVKSGRTAAGRRAASSHTAALATGDVAVDALFRQTGVIRTGTLEELFDVAGLLTSQPLPRGERVAILTNAGGPGILCADACESHGLQVPDLSEGTKEQLRAFLPAEAGTDNPVDMIASGTAQQYGRALEVLGRADEIDAVIVIFIPPVITEAGDVAREIVAANEQVPDEKPVVSVFMSAKGVPAELSEARIPSYAFPEDAARALGRVAQYARWRSSPHGDVVRPDGIDAERARLLVDRALADPERTDEGGDGGRRLIGSTHRPVAATPDQRTSEDAGVWLDAAEAAELLGAYGVRFAASSKVASAEEAAEAQREIGAPVAVKLAAPIHKSDVGGIRLGLATPEEAAGAVRAIRDELSERGLDDYGESFIVQEMIADGAGGGGDRADGRGDRADGRGDRADGRGDRADGRGDRADGRGDRADGRGDRADGRGDPVEMVVGVTHDPSFGPVLMAGFGGTLVELLQDVSVRVTPVTDLDVDEMLRSLKAYRLLTGYRGSTPVDVGALRDLLYRVNALVEDVPEVAELDLNPVFVRREGAVAVDVRLRLASASGTPSITEQWA